QSSLAYSSFVQSWSSLFLFLSFFLPSAEMHDGNYLCTILWGSELVFVICLALSDTVCVCACVCVCVCVCLCVSRREGGQREMRSGGGGVGCCWVKEKMAGVCVVWVCVGVGVVVCLGRTCSFPGADGRDGGETLLGEAAAAGEHVGAISICPLQPAG